MALSPKSFLYRHDPATGVATITLNRPERLNALTFEVYAELRDTFARLGVERGERVAQLGVHLERECVEPFGAVQRDRRDARRGVVAVQERLRRQSHVSVSPG